MSEGLRDSAGRHFQKTLSLMQEGNLEKALKELKQTEETAKLLLKDPKNEFFQSNLQKSFYNVFTLGYNLHDIGRFSQAQNFYELSLFISQTLLANDPDNVSYQSDVGTTLNNLGLLLADMGRIEEAKKRYENALEIYETLLANDPDNVSYQSDVAMTLNNLGNLLADMGCIEESKQRYEKTLEIKQTLLANDLENVSYQSSVAMTLNNLGNLLSDMGRIEEAKQRYENALETRQSLLATDPANVSYQSNVAMTLNNLGALLSDMGRIEESKQRYEKALETRQSLLATDPANVSYQSDVAMTLNNLGNLLSDMGRIDEAKKRYENALEIYEKLLATDPKNVSYQSDVAMTLNNLGALLSDMGRIEESKQRYEKALEIYEKLLATDPANVSYQSYVGTTLNNLGNLFWNMGRIEEAKKRYEKALEIRQTLLATDPANVSYQSYVGTTLNNLGNLFWNMGRIEEAKKRYEKSLEISENLLKTDPANVSYQSYVGTTLNNLGLLLSDMGRIDEAKKRYEKALEIRQTLLANNPANVSYQSYVGTTLNNLGLLLSDMGRIDESKQRYENALEIYETLLETDPENVSYQSYVAMTLNNLGLLLSDMGRIDESKQRYENALKMRQNLLVNDPANVVYQSNFAETLNGFGTLLNSQDEIEEAKKRHEQALEIRKKLLESDYENVVYLSNVGETLNDLGTSLYKLGQFQEAKERFERSLKIREDLLETDPENVIYRSKVGETLNNLGILLFDMGRIEEAKQRYEESLAIYTEPMQYLTIGKKSNSIIRLIELNSILATEEKEPLDRMRYLKEVYKLCKNNQEFFIKYELRNERKLVIEAGLNAYIDFLMKRMKLENGFEKRAEKYGKALDAVKKLEELEKEEVISRLYISAACYLEGRKYINEAMVSGKTELGRVSEAVEKFKEASQNYKKADVCYNVYSGLLNILGYVEGDGEVKVRELEKVVAEAVKPFQDDANLSGIKASLESIPKIFQEKSKTTRRQRQEEFEERISLIESKALENLFGHVNRKIKDYFEKPLNLNIIYEKWILKVRFLDPEQIKGKLTIKIGDKILFDRALSKDETEKGLLEINLRELGYLPQGEDKISFMPTGQKKPVFETVNYFEKITNGHEIRILQYDCSNQICIGKEPKIAVVQLKYHAYKENSVIKISTDDNYHKKVIAILEALKNEADIIVFPEFSIPFDYLEEMQKFADENGILIVAGSHYVVDENLEKYGKLFTREFEEADLLKNISPVVIPSSKIVHNEKYLGARIERSVFSEEGMEPGKVNHIFRLQEKLNIGVMICYEFLDTELRHRLIPVCNIILVPQTNNNPQSFYETASTDINRPLEGGNTAFVMANGIFTVEAEENVLGGSAGIALTLDKHSNAQKEKGIISPVNGAMEQLILLATINTGYFPAWDSQIGQVPITTKIIHIFEESEILKDPEGNGKEFIQFLKEIDSCKNSSELKELLEKNRRDLNQKENEGKEKKSLIEQYSPLMNKQIQDLKNHNLEKLKKKCSFILIPAI